MVKLNAYLNFDGNARQAVEYYSAVFGAEAQILAFGDVPANAEFEMSEEMKQRVMHASMTIGENQFMFSDTMPGMEFIVGNNVNLSIHGTDAELLTAWFEKLAVEGEVTVPLAPTFWGPLYGALKDCFGIYWQFNVEQAK